eukprot:GHVQ01039200.1.p1 GENE.GHVQ01039200.1~~GHVQ01039200.1.p1  ORF type:complete len:111 (-),score=8.06 GHVQ01039200.1:89-421(-)
MRREIKSAARIEIVTANATAPKNQSDTSPRVEGSFCTHNNTRKETSPIHEMTNAVPTAIQLSTSSELSYTQPMLAASPTFPLVNSPYSSLVELLRSQWVVYAGNAGWRHT